MMRHMSPVVDFTFERVDGGSFRLAEMASEAGILVILALRRLTFLRTPSREDGQARRGTIVARNRRLRHRVRWQQQFARDERPFGLALPVPPRRLAPFVRTHGPQPILATQDISASRCSETTCDGR